MWPSRDLHVCTATCSWVLISNVADGELSGHEVCLETGRLISISLYHLPMREWEGVVSGGFRGWGNGGLGKER